MKKLLYRLWINEYSFAATFSLLLCMVVFSPTVLRQQLPIATDILTGSHYPWENIAFPDIPFPFPVKNMESFDAVREMFPWRYLVIEQYKAGQWPLWNPAQLSGSPLAGNFLAAPFYPLNIVFFVMSFAWGWGILSILQVYLACMFMYFFLRSSSLHRFAAVFGAVAFCLSGFMAGFFHSNVMNHSFLWTPLALFAINKLVKSKIWGWSALLAVAVAMIGLASFLQILLYSCALLGIYILFKFSQTHDIQVLLKGFVGMTLGILLSAIQLIPSVEMLLQSSRLSNLGGNIDNLLSPLHHILLFWAPDYFGNPGKWNYFPGRYYHEYSFYIGIATICFALLVLTKIKKNRTVIFWFVVTIVTLLMSIDNPLSRLPIELKLPFLASITPTRAYAYTDLAISVLCAMGINMLFEKDKKGVSKMFFGVTALAALSFGILAVNSLVPGTFFSKYLFDNPVYRSISLRNLVIPVGITALSLILIYMSLRVQQKKLIYIFLSGLLFITTLDLTRQFRLQNGFVSPASVFPETQITKLLSSKPLPARIISIDDRVLTPNIGAYYGWENIDGYQPERSNAYERAFATYDALPSTDKKSFGKIISIVEPKSQVVDLLGADYVFSRYPLETVANDKNYVQVIEEGGVYGYENRNAVPRFHLVNESLEGRSDLDLMNNRKIVYDASSIEVVEYGANSFTLRVNNLQDPQVLQTMVINYPGWTASVNGEDQSLEISDEGFIGVNAPQGESVITFAYKPLSFTIGLVITSLSLLIVMGMILHTVLIKLKSR